MIDTAVENSTRRTGFNALVRAGIRTIRQLERISYDTLLSTPARIFIGVTFWLSGQTKVEGWHLKASTFYLFEHEYALPIIPYEVAAYMATFAEHVFSILLIIGLASRFSAAALLTMTLIIEIFVYPDAWPTHLLWASALTFILTRGPGALSVDHWIRLRVMGRERHSG